MGGLAVVQDFRLTPTNIVLSEDMTGLTVTFDRIRIPTGGSTTFEVPLDDENFKPEKELVGVIVDQHAARTYWSERGQNRPPDCTSMDGLSGTATPVSGLEWAGSSRSCADCPLNMWGSGDQGRGKACKELRRLYLLRAGDVFPLVLTLPPTSLLSFGNYLGKRVLPSGLRLHQVVTRITLERVVSKAGNPFARARFALVGRLDDQTAQAVALYAKRIQALTRGQAPTTDDYQASTPTADGTADTEETF